MLPSTDSSLRATPPRRKALLRPSVQHAWLTPGLLNTDFAAVDAGLCEDNGDKLHHEVGRAEPIHADPGRGRRVLPEDFLEERYAF